MRAFLAEKEKRSGSRATVEAYGRILGRFFRAMNKATALVTPGDVLSFAYSQGPSGKEPSAASVNLRLTAISSFYGFLLRMGLAASNPADMVQRARQETPPARGLDREEIRRLLTAVPDTLAGKRDRAIILTFLLTGRRRSEVMGLRAGDLSRNGAIFHAYRGKGGRYHRRELPEPCLLAILEALSACGKDLREMTQRSRCLMSPATASI